MKPCKEIAHADVPGGEHLILTLREDAWVIMVDGIELMTSREYGSEQSLAELCLVDLAKRPSARVLIGGLGMGYTLRACLDRLAPDATVVVAELVPEVVEWNRLYLPELSGHALDDPRVVVEVADVRAVVRRDAASFDAIMLDVDNGPDDIIFERNRGLYGRKGLASLSRALRPGGVLGIWSVSRQEAAVDQLNRAGFLASERKVPARSNGRGGARFIYLGRV